MDSVKEIQEKLRKYKESEIVFNEPHFTNQLIAREGNKEEVINNLLNPENLIYYYKEKGKRGDDVYCLYFRKSHDKTMKIPVIFTRMNNKKVLYILTYIMRYRPWHRMIKDKRVRT